MQPQYGDVQTFDTFPKLLRHNAQNWPDEVAMREKEFGIWREFSWAEYYRQVKLFALGLHALGVRRGDVVGLIGQNRPEWIWGEVAAHALGAMSLGIYQDSLNEEAAYLINYAQARVIIAEDEEQVDKLLEVAEAGAQIDRIIYCDPRGMRKYDDPRLFSADELRKLAEELDHAHPGLFDQEIDAGKASDVAILCTTSGTTAKPKMAMLQAGPFLRHSLAYLRADPKYPGDDYVSVLPLPWIMEQVYAVAQSLISRITVNFVEEPETTMSDLREVGPTFVLLAPRVWENIAADVRARMMDADRFKRAVYAFGMKLGMKALGQGRQSRLAHWLLFRPLKDRLGFTYLRSAATGGAALGPETFRFFLAMGIPLRQLYGQTELAGAYTIHAPDDVDFDSVGMPMEDSDVRIENPDGEGVGEIVARNAGTFLGYYKDEAETAKDLRGGWLFTGDAGYFKAENGHLVVIDRVKDLATTTTGHRFSPQFIENKLKFSPFVAEAVVLGNDRPFLTAILCIRFPIVSRWAENRGLSFTNYTNLSTRAEVSELLQREVEQVNVTLPEYQRIQKFVLLYKELDPDDEELTRTRKVRRGVINERYAGIIDAMYGDSDSVHVDTVITFQDGTKTRIRTDLRIARVGVAKRPAKGPAPVAAQ